MELFQIHEFNSNALVQFLFCGITKNHYTKYKQVPSKVYSVRCVGCVECEGVTVCTVTGVAKHQLTCSGRR